MNHTLQRLGSFVLPPTARTAANSLWRLVRQRLSMQYIGALVFGGRRCQHSLQRPSMVPTKQTLQMNPPGYIHTFDTWMSLNRLIVHPGRGTV